MIDHLCDIQVLLVALNGADDVPQRRVHRPHVAQLTCFGQPTLGLSRQQHALLVARQRVGIVADGCVHVAQTAEGIGRRLKPETQVSHTQDPFCL